MSSARCWCSPQLVKSVASLVFFQSGPDSLILLEGHAPCSYMKGIFPEMFSVINAILSILKQV